MQYRELAPGLSVSEIGFGNWTCTTGWWGEYSEAEAVELHRVAFDAGITFFDTAHVYRDGYGEEVLGKALGRVRDQVVLATKFGYDIQSSTGRRGQQERPHRTDPVSLRRALEASLRRLGTDVIDVWQLHNPRLEHIDDDDLFAFLDEAKQAGKIRASAVALGPKIGWRDEGVRAMKHRELDAIHMILNILEQDPGRELLDVAAATHTKAIVRVPHSSGMLEGNFTADTVFAADDHRRHRPRSWLVDGVQKVRRLRFLEHSGRTLGQAALSWVLSEDEVATTLPNIYDRDQLREFAQASDAPPLTEEELAEVAKLYAVNFEVIETLDQPAPH